MNWPKSITSLCVNSCLSTFPPSCKITLKSPTITQGELSQEISSNSSHNFILSTLLQQAYIDEIIQERSFLQNFIVIYWLESIRTDPVQSSSQKIHIFVDALNLALSNPNLILHWSSLLGSWKGSVRATNKYLFLLCRSINLSKIFWVLTDLMF